MTIEQGDPRLLESEIAHRLLASTTRIDIEYLAQIDHPGTRMARIAVRPAWVGALDFQTRLPSALGGA